MADPHGDALLMEELRRALAGRYEVERPLGKGGMGSVFLGRDPTLDRRVAIKVVDPELSASRAIRERFLHEARTVARLRHPSIVAVHAAGEADGLLWFVMEYVEGESLRELLERERCCADDRARPILRDVAGALAYAHAQGVVHRDIKPDNILLERATGRAMVTDFGIARALATGDARLTGTGLVVGSPRYMSPEQAAGEREIDGRSDIYSLGLVGYEMYAGEPAYSTTSGPTLIVKQMTEKPLPLATRTDRVPEDVAAAIDRALEKDPAARWQTASDFARAIGGEDPATLTGATTAARPRRAARKRAALAAVLLGLLVAAGGAILATRAGGVPRGVDPRKSYFVAPFDVLTRDPQLEWLREGSVSMLTRNLSQWEDLSVVDYERTLDLLRDAELGEGEKLVLEDARRLARDAGAWTVVMGRVTNTPDSLVVFAQTYDVASGRRVNQAQRSARRGADPRSVFDALARDLLDLAGAPPITIELAKTTTSSVEAYRAYLEGVQALNAWQLARADSLFQRAIDADSTFALAYYRRALTLGWSSPGDSTQLSLVARARDLSARLPRREREIVSAYSDLTGALSAEFAFDTTRRNALFRSAQAKYAAIVQRDSGAAEGWYGLGDAYYHHRPTGQNGRESASNMSRSLRAFDRTLALDSSFHLAYSHKIDLYAQAAAPFSGLALDGDSLLLLPDEAARRAYGEQRLTAARERARQLAVRDGRLWVEANPVPQAYQGLAQVYMQAGAFDSAVAVLQEGVRLHPGVRESYIAYGLPAIQTRTDPVAALASLRTALREVTGAELREGSGTDRFSIVLAGASAAAVGGSVTDLREAARVAVEAEPTIVGIGMSREPQAQWLLAGTLLAMGMPPTRHLAVIDSGMRGLDRMKAPVGPQVRQFSTPTLYIAYLATREARYLDALRRWRAEGGATQPWAELDALEALARGDTAAARAQAARFPAPDSMRAAGGQLAPMRWIARAEVLEALGDARGAVAMYDVLEPRRFSGNGPLDPGLALYARSFLDRGRLLEQLGERERAAESYERFLELWRDADPALEPQKKEARDGLERVRKGMTPRG